ncbi:chromosome segregation protein [Nosema bombycis CQ1]|uniref:Chromosome segregation protein n=1 Tax=Nosema bombycis (strain CQ1 / CVCC 102059) TaxID=578461 RepID=R0MHV4_NOSB1|nr:chromosome segregation protein [Nosema bombycis CQ1]|eukprot:EOB13730.1 chromosome segregation protein [Nosema bombycis CQ1]
MHIKDIILDGFKCYENPTVLRNLDKSYNAITGLNGSGKSNIIDAIVFTLGLESKKLLRANTMKDLINTHRQDCKVTLILSNKDKFKSPPGYKDYNEIIISRSLDSQGKSKFSINNHICTSSTISKFCSSIGIHSEKNSPFIVMQGHITKVLNMKSKEIGTLIEETAGTRSYTKEKEKALQVLEKKEIKLKGVRDAMERRISPFYERLSQERVAFIEQKTAEEKKIKTQEEIKKFKDLLKKSEISKGILILKENIKEYSKDYEELKGIEEKIINLEKEDYAHENHKLKNELEDEKYNLKKVMNGIEEVCNGGDVDGSKVGYDGDPNGNTEDPYNDSNNNPSHYNNTLTLLKEKEKILLDNLRSSGNLFGVSNQIKNREELALLESKKLEEEIKLKNIKVNEDLVDLDKKINFLNNLKVNDEDLKSKLNRLEFLKSKINYPFIKGVYGSIGENIKIKDKKYSEAINTILGNKIKHIIVENEVIGGDLLKKADRRISVIPLNKIITKKEIKINIKGGTKALDLIDFNLNLKKAIEYVLGNIFVFENKEEARRSCFEFGVLCVTLDGVVYDPKGTVTGGKSIGKVEIVTKKEIEELENEIQKMNKNKNEFEKNKKEYEKLIKEKELIKEKKEIKEKIKIIEVKIETIRGIMGVKEGGSKGDINEGGSKARLKDKGGKGTSDYINENYIPPSTSLKKDLEDLRKEILKVTIEQKRREEQKINLKEKEEKEKLRKDLENEKEKILKSIKNLENEMSRAGLATEPSLRPGTEPGKILFFMKEGVILHEDYNANKKLVGS